MKKSRWILIGIIIIIVFILVSIFLFKYEDVTDDADHIKNIEEEHIKDEDNGTAYIKDTGDKEEMMMNIIAMEDSKEHLERVLQLFPDVDFDKIENSYGEGSVLKILEWLSKQDIQKEEDIILLINMMDDFYREEYSKLIEIIANSYLRDKIIFIKALTKIPNKTKQVAYVLHDFRTYDKSDQDLFNDLEMIVNSKELTNEERNIGVELLSSYSECGT